jgi:MSHA pilin protein MshA
MSIQKKSKKSKKSSGFTIIELVIVVIILGILAAFAIPRFISLSSQARSSVIQGMAGSMRGAAALARSLAETTGSTTTVSMEGVTVDLVNLYPAANNTGIIGALSGSTDLGSTDLEIVTANDTLTVRYKARTGCSVGYTAAAANSAPTITVADLANNC